MDKSETLQELAKALCEVQKTELFALTDKENPFFKSKYADLSSVWNVIRKPLTDNGLSVIQTMDIADNGIVIETTLLHISGEYITGHLLIDPEKKTPQGIGSAITYGRRYALSAIVGISPIDDDGEAAMDRQPKNNLMVPAKIKLDIDSIKTVEGLSQFYHKHKDDKKIPSREFNSLITARKAQLNKKDSNENIQ